MGLVIQDAEVERLAEEVALATGETVTNVIKSALAKRLDELHIEDAGRPKASLEELRAIAKRLASMRTGPAIDHGEYLYDENGLPK
jgi:antitoxin VapB